MVNIFRTPAQLTRVHGHADKPVKVKKTQKQIILSRDSVAAAGR